MRIPAAVLALALAACATGEVSGPQSADLAGSAPALTMAGGAAQFTAFGQNVYVGANVDLVLPALLSPDPADDLPALLTAAAVLQETDFTVRAAAMAREIERTRPHAVGLNEISTIDVDLTPLGVPVVIHEDFLPELLAALAARGLNYVVAGAMQGLVAAPPLPFGAVVSIVDRDVLLLDASRVTLAGGVVTGNYTARVGPIAAGVNVVRSFVIAPVLVEGRPYTVAATHLDSDIGGFPALDFLRAAQATELAAYLPPGVPTIILGDLNDVPGSPMHQVLAGNGFVDVWSALRPEQAGFTCCHADNLGNPLATHDERIDYVWARGVGGPQGRLMGSIDRYGTTPSDQVAGPFHSLWPSDHAGLVARLLTPAAVLP